MKQERSEVSDQLSEKIRKAKTLIATAAGDGTRLAVLSSFGKDSMVMLHLVSTTLKRDPLSCHLFPLPVIYWRDPWFEHKHGFAQEIARSWGMEVHDYMPVAAGVKCDERQIELVARYSLGFGYMDVPKNVCAPEEFPRRDYLCGLRDWVLRPKAGAITFPWDTLLHGHKSSDVDPFEGAVPLRSDRERLNERIELFFPLRDWSDEDVWSYIERHHLPVQQQRYFASDGPESTEAKWWANDYTHACTRCVDPRSDAGVAVPEKVFCPKLQTLVPNVGAKVLRLDTVPDYIMKSKTKEKIYALGTE